MKYEGPRKEVLEAAALIAPVVRGLTPAAKRRRVKVYDRSTGEVKGEVSYADAVAGVLAAHQIEIQVDDGVRPKEFQCKACGRVAVMPRSGPLQKFCRVPCHCVTPGCNGLAPSVRAVRQAFASGNPPRCAACTSRQRAEAMADIGRKRQASLSCDERREIARRAALRAAEKIALLNPEQKRARTRAARAAYARLSPERRAEIGRNSMSPDQRREAGRKGGRAAQAAMTHEQSLDKARAASVAAAAKGWATRRANAKRRDAS